MVPSPCDVPTAVHLFPGQGDFHLRALQKAAQEQPVVRRAAERVFTAIDSAIGAYGLPPLSGVVLDSGADSRHLTSGPAGLAESLLYGACLTVHEALCAMGTAPSAVAGFSFGEITAMAAAGVFSVGDGARIAVVLARTMPQRHDGLLRLRASADQADAFLSSAHEPELIVACVNTPCETVLAGPIHSVERAHQLAIRYGLSATRLPTPYFAHHPKVAYEAMQFSDQVSGLRSHAPRIALHLASQSRPFAEEDVAAKVLADCMVKPADLPALLRRISDPGSPLLWLEAGTGLTMTRCATQVIPNATTWAPLTDPAFLSPRPAPAMAPRVAS